MSEGWFNELLRPKLPSLAGANSSQCEKIQPPLQCRSWTGLAEQRAAVKARSAGCNGPVRMRPRVGPNEAGSPPSRPLAVHLEREHQAPVVGAQGDRVAFGVTARLVTQEEQVASA
jgi:hypothetical protein